MANIHFQPTFSNAQQFRNGTLHTNSQKSVSEPDPQEQEKLTFIPLNKILPANQILSKEVKGDNQAKIIMRNKFEEEKNKEKQKMEMLATGAQLGIINIQQKICFQEEDCLGYEFQAKFQRFLVYSRIMGSLTHKEWLKYMTYAHQCDNLKQKKPNIRYLAGLFTNNMRQSFDGSQEFIKVNNPHNFQNNLCMLTNAQQKNYQPALIKFYASLPSANLMYAFRSGLNQFSLILHNDTNSKGSTQWFNFSIALPQKHSFNIIKFNIVNLTKSSSLYSKGMRVLYKRNKQTNWRKIQSQSSYFENQIDIQGRQQETKYRTLSFQYNTKQHKQNHKNGEEVISFAYGYPYTFEDNLKFWRQFQKNVPNFKRNKSKMCVKRQVIGNSISGIPIQVFKIAEQQKRKSLSTTVSLNWLSNKLISPLKYKSIVFLARQHPGQTQGSYITEGIVNCIMNEQAQKNIKKNFIYYFIPMVNVDGVLLGNYRTNIKGYDLNRNWRNPISEAQPQVIAIKKHLLKINREHEIILIIDLHGHSKAMNSFFYGVNKVKCKENPKLFPYYCSKKMKQVSFEQSYFHISEDKKNTARAVLSQNFPKALVYTVETSFYGYETTEKQETRIVQYTPNQLRKFGSDLLSTYLQYSQLQLDKKDSNLNLLNNNNLSNKTMNTSKQLLQKQVLQFELNGDRNYLQWTDSDSEAEKQLMDVEKTVQKTQQMAQKENQKMGNKKQEKLRKVVTIMSNSTIHRKRGHTFGTKGQGRYLKTIEMIDTTRSELNDDLYIHKYDRNKQKENYSKLKQSKKVIRKSTQKLQQKQNHDNRQQKLHMPLLSVNMIKPKSSPQIAKNNGCNDKNQREQKVKFVNQKQLAFEEVKMRRIKGSHQQQQNMLANVIKNGLMPAKMVNTGKTRNLGKDQSKERTRTFNIKF